MSVLVELKGIPANADISATLTIVKMILKKYQLKYWMNDLTNIEGTNTKKCKVHFYNILSATTAVDKITKNNHQTIAGTPCNLEATIICENFETKRKRGIANQSDTSHSPTSKEALLDKELEQLKKEKEELVKKKTELLNKKIKVEQTSYNTDKKLKKVIQTANANILILTKHAALELIIMEQMKPLLKAHAQKRYYQNFMQCVHVEIRSRLAVLLETTKLRRTSPPPEIVEAYRYKYPEDSDKITIDNLVSQVKMAFWPYKPSSDSTGELYEYDESDDEQTIDDQGLSSNETSIN